MKKIITTIIVLAVIFTATYFISKNMTNNDVIPSDNETQEVATSTGEAISSAPTWTERDVNYKKTTVPYTNSCLGITHSSNILGGGNSTLGPYPYPVELDFVGTVDDNLKINGKIVDGDKGIQSGSPCSHLHSLAYKTNIPANTPIKIEVVDQHGVEASLIGKLRITPIVISPNQTYRLRIHYNNNEIPTVYRGRITPPSGGVYAAGTTAVLTAEPIKGFMVQWDGPCASQYKTCQVLMNSDKTINVSWKKRPGWICTLSFGSFGCTKEW
jgi:uncharacterized protein (UPF0333 family)